MSTPSFRKEVPTQAIDNKVLVLLMRDGRATWAEVGQALGAAFLRAIAKMEQVAECHHVAGDDDYLLKVRCRGTQDLDHLLASELKDKLGVARTRTTIVLSTAKESVLVPIGPEE
jgi:DNA-binding Lrp family transcriptional regulator